MPGEHSDHVGDNEGGGRPGHQEEGDEGHPLQKAQHRGAAAEGAQRSAGRDAGLLRAAWRRRPRTCQSARRRPRLGMRLVAGPEAPGRPGQAGEGEKREEPREVAGCKAAGPGWVGRGWPELIAKRVKSQSGCWAPAIRRQAATSPRRLSRVDQAPFTFDSDAAGWV